MVVHKDWQRRLHRALGERIVTARRRHEPRITQEQLAAKTGGFLTRSTIASIENGRQAATIDQLFRISSALDIEPMALLPSRKEVFGSDEKQRRTAREEEFLRGIGAANAAKEKGPL